MDYYIKEIKYLKGGKRFEARWSCTIKIKDDDTPYAIIIQPSLIKLIDCVQNCKQKIRENNPDCEFNF